MKNVLNTYICVFCFRVLVYKILENIFSPIISHFPCFAEKFKYSINPGAKYNDVSKIRFSFFKHVLYAKFPEM